MCLVHPKQPAYLSHRFFVPPPATGKEWTLQQEDKKELTGKEKPDSFFSFFRECYSKAWELKRRAQRQALDLVRRT